MNFKIGDRVTVNELEKTMHAYSFSVYGMKGIVVNVIDEDRVEVDFGDIILTIEEIYLEKCIE